MKIIKLSEEDYNYFIEMCDREPESEQIATLKNLFSIKCPWDVTSSDGLEDWEWDDE